MDSNCLVRWEFSEVGRRCESSGELLETARLNLFPKLTCPRRQICPCPKAMLSSCLRGKQTHLTVHLLIGMVGRAWVLTEQFPMNLTIISGFYLFLFGRKILKISLWQKVQKNTEFLKLQLVQLSGQQR